MLPTTNALPDVRKWFVGWPGIDPAEAPIYFKWVCADRLGLNLGTLNLGYRFSESDINVFAAVLKQLANDQPIQYIIGEVEFFGLKLKVDARALIPRPETEELTHIIIEENKTQGLRVCDVGTGSGCLAVALAKNLPNAHVAAVDISANALALASSNAAKCGVNVQFFQFDVLTDAWPVGSVDLVASNPPYIPISEKSAMARNVVEAEPHLALFVPDADPLVFYRNIGQHALKWLSANGKLYFECHWKLAHQVATCLTNLGFSRIEVITDLSGRQRFVRAMR